ncbi:MAG: hypothetical protein V2A73_08400 [Pseudomonadota bacterium]
MLGKYVVSTLVGAALPLFSGLCACYSPNYGNGDFVCGEGGACPPGYECSSSNNRCYRKGKLPSDAARPDGVNPDAAGADATRPDGSGIDGVGPPDGAGPDGAGIDGAGIDGSLPDAAGPDAMPDARSDASPGFDGGPGTIKALQAAGGGGAAGTTAKPTVSKTVVTVGQSVTGRVSSPGGVAGKPSRADLGLLPAATSEESVK